MVYTSIYIRFVKNLRSQIDLPIIPSKYFFVNLFVAHPLTRSNKKKQYFSYSTV
ncbi:hypothetical protein PGB90_003497 [Kerria lacca]